MLRSLLGRMESNKDFLSPKIPYSTLVCVPGANDLKSYRATAGDDVSDHITRGLPGLSGKTLRMEMDLPMMI
jgi:hypothetical protein